MVRCVSDGFRASWSVAGPVDGQAVATTVAAARNSECSTSDESAPAHLRIELDATLCGEASVRTERELFEQWWFRDTPSEYRADVVNRVRDQDGYVRGTRVAAAWDGWQGARKSQSWIRTSQHCPTRLDADQALNVLAWTPEGFAVVASFEDVANAQSGYTHWIPLPSAPEN